MLQPHNFSLEVLPDDTKLLRFDSVLVNAGRGALELVGRGKPSNGTLSVIQRIQDDVGGWTARLTRARMEFAGDGHDHWHVQSLQLFTISAAATPTVALGRDAKVGFCFSDNHTWISKSPAVYNMRVCEMRADDHVPMGLSVGWGDEYRSTMPFQYIDITNLPNGIYVVRHEADPGGAILELNERNNGAWAVISIRADAVRVLSSATELDES